MSRLKGRYRKSTVGKCNVSIAGRYTSVSLENAFWQSRAAAGRAVDAALAVGRSVDGRIEALAIDNTSS
jgi:predicted DNA-binding ribbon-helix-helix protein